METDRPNSLLLAKYEIKKNLVFVSFYGKSLTQKKKTIYIYIYIKVSFLNLKKKSFVKFKTKSKTKNKNKKIFCQMGKWCAISIFQCTEPCAI